MLKTVLPFRLEPDFETSLLTAHAGIPLFIELWRQMHIDKLIAQHVRIREMGYGAVSLLKTIIVMMVAGGKSMMDITILNADRALNHLIGNTITPCDQTLGRYVRAFHKPRNKPKGYEAWVPPESDELIGLNKINQAIVKKIIAMSGLTTVTIENDATAIFCDKRAAQPTYKGGLGYMPVVGSIAELGLILTDEFRDGNVTPSHNPIPFLMKCRQALPPSVIKIKVRFDGAYYQHELIAYLNFWKIDFTITAMKSDGIMRWIYNLKEIDWQPLLDNDGIDTGKDYTDMSWVSANGSQEDMAAKVLRYLITRVRHPKDLKDPKDRFEVIATSMVNQSADELIRWHYKRGGAIEHIHDRVKNDLSAKHLPCGEFGANAAWFRLAVIAFNLVRALQILAMPAPYKNCHVKTLRLWLFNIAGRVIRTGRETILKIAHGHPMFESYKNAREKIAALCFP